MVLEETILQKTNSFYYFLLQNLKTKKSCFYFNKEGAPEVYLEGVIKNGGRLLKKIEQKTMIACRVWCRTATKTAVGFLAMDY